MSAKVPQESRIVSFFQTAPLDQVTVVHNIVNGIVKARKADEQGDPIAAPAPKAKRKPRKSKQAELSIATSAE